MAAIDAFDDFGDFLESISCETSKPVKFVVRIHVGEPLLFPRALLLFRSVAVSIKPPAWIAMPILFGQRNASSYNEVMKTTAPKTLSYSVFYEQDSEGGFLAFVPSLPGCHTQGENPRRNGT
jgi:hypothetical protein